MLGNIFCRASAVCVLLSTVVLSGRFVQAYNQDNPVASGSSGQVVGDLGVALGIRGEESYSRQVMIDVVNTFPNQLFALVNNSNFEVQVTELVIEDLPGEGRMLIDPRTGEPSAVKAAPLQNDWGSVIGVDVTLPPQGVAFRSTNGLISSHYSIVAHEARHAHQISLGLFGTHGDLPNLVAAENDAQKFENSITGHDLSYFENKHGEGASFFDAISDIKQRKTVESVVPQPQGMTANR
ncbi:MAG: hypothetical protein AAF202_07160 [Pseudomonadota bacterium]